MNINFTGNSVESAKNKINGLVSKVSGIVDSFNENIAVIEAGTSENLKKIAELESENKSNTEAMEYAKRVRDKFAEIIA